nr:sigma factor [Sporosarcina jiandibaonis]
MVHTECHKIKARARMLGHTYEDMESVGFIGLINAFDRFDGERNIKFSTFATPQIWGELQKFLIRSNPGIYYPKHIKEIAYKIWRNDAVDLPISETAEKVSESAENVKYALDFLRNGQPAHLENEVEETGHELQVMLGISDDQTDLYVQEFVGTLTDLEKVVITNLMVGKTMSEIARSIGFTPAYIGHIRKNLGVKYLKFSSGMKRGARV